VGVRGDLLIVHDEDLGLKIEQCEGTIAWWKFLREANVLLAIWTNGEDFETGKF
jgi:hypothetical protein